MRLYSVVGPNLQLHLRALSDCLASSPPTTLASKASRRQAHRHPLATTSTDAAIIGMQVSLQTVRLSSCYRYGDHSAMPRETPPSCHRKAVCIVHQPRFLAPLGDDHVRHPSKPDHVRSRTYDDNQVILSSRYQVPAFTPHSPAAEPPPTCASSALASLGPQLRLLPQYGYNVKRDARKKEDPWQTKKAVENLRGPAQQKLSSCIEAQQLVTHWFRRHGTQSRA